MSADPAAQPGRRRSRRLASWRAIWCLLWLAGYAAALATVLGMLGAHAWVLDLFTHFRVQYAAILLVVIPVQAWRRRWLLLTPLAAALLVNALTVAPLYMPAPHDAAEPGPRVELLSFNVNLHNPRMDEVLAYLQAAQPAPDVIAVLEVPAHWIDELARAFPGHRMVHARRTDAFALAVLARPPVIAAELMTLTERALPVAEVVIERDGQRVAILAVHPPPPISAAMARLRDQAIEEAARWAAGQRAPAVVMGDLNATPWSRALSPLRARGLVSSLPGAGVQPTWPRQLWPLRIPIDHVLHARSLRTVARRTGPFLGSDHRPVHATLALPPP